MGLRTHNVKSGLHVKLDRYVSVKCLPSPLYRLFATGGFIARTSLRREVARRSP